MTRQDRIGACGRVVVLAGVLVLAGCGTVPGSAWSGSATGYLSGSAVAGSMAATATVSATGTVVREPRSVPSRAVVSQTRAGVAPGIAAIRPTRSSAGPDDPAFTEEDARDYVARNGADGFRMVATGPVTIDRVVFARGEDVGWPDYPLLCLVLVRGDYRLVGGPPPPPGVSLRTPITSDGITLIFDAHTGNDLGASGSLWATPIAAR